MKACSCSCLGPTMFQAGLDEYEPVSSERVSKFPFSSAHLSRLSSHSQARERGGDIFRLLASDLGLFFCVVFDGSKLLSTLESPERLVGNTSGCVSGYVSRDD